MVDMNLSAAVMPLIYVKDGMVVGLGTGNSLHGFVESRCADC